MSRERRANPPRAVPAGRGGGARRAPADEARVGYFTMEVGLESGLPTYSGGLGVLAGDYLRSAADLGLPLVAVTLLYRDGYFRQLLDSSGHQSEEPVRWRPAQVLELLDARVSVEICGRQVRARAWRRELVGVTGAIVPVYFLDTDFDDNHEEDRSLTDQLYGGDALHRLSQEALLGIGGIDLLGALGHVAITTFHMNEGHSSLLTLRLLEVAGPVTGGREVLQASVRASCAFTTHTPVPAGHDRFPADLVRQVLGDRRSQLLESLGQLETGELDMTELGSRQSRFVNAVSRRHREVAQAMLPDVEVKSITNGVHSARWAAPSLTHLFDRYVAGWRRDSSLLRYATCIPLDGLADAHTLEKRRLLEEVARRTGKKLDEEALTIGLARRVTRYKQTTLLFSDLDRLRGLAASGGPVQVVCSGKAHPHDEPGKALLEQLVQAAEELADDVSVVFVENYDLEVASLLCAGCDVWLNTPAKPNEASGTSGMKAAVNGVPSLSVLDGWWIEGWIEGVTGWSIGQAGDEEVAAEDLYDKLETTVVPTFYRAPTRYDEIRRAAIALNGAFFATDRMAREYSVLAYGL